MKLETGVKIAYEGRWSDEELTTLRRSLNELPITIKPRYGPVPKI